ncbi:helix-turn-helix transcriptional regulator [Lysobacter yananisis]|uniref:Helix-turn-helix transcriptional regulator n=1 Tax=Lysobacter yananisis TaxID=1003114 RepID=A0ABY9PDX1_9GAMM|nr:helix-turn-helix transcriptional regulator [Lysobacter yananisis]WMT05272.1 helix-turn-helix transcriptional regulator [Lysobacter yananisis]
MPKKSVHQDEHAILVRLLKEMRQASGITQVALAEVLGRSQSHISDIESGTRRLDLIQLREYCAACNVSLSSFVKRFELAIR